MMKKITQVVILYNPKSTGASKDNAEALYHTLEKQLPPSCTLKIRKTEYAGHGEKIARFYAKQTPTTLLISSSGDGGYNEVINGALSVSPAHVVTGVLPSGNANDHWNALGKEDITKDILTSHYKMIDVIKVSSVIGGQPWVRYAHSYVGIGVSPVIGKQLTKTKLNVINEKWLLLKQLFTFAYSKIIVNGKTVKYSSLLFSNIDRMSKVIRLSDELNVSDGKFEIHAVRHQTTYKILLYLLTAVTVGVQEHASKDSYEFTTITPLLIQLDGEVYKLDAHAKVSIESAHNALTCIV